jgi:hypothetical protein
LVPFSITTVPVGPTLGESVNAGFGAPGGVVVVVVPGTVVVEVPGAVVVVVVIGLVVVVDGGWHTVMGKVV